MISAAVTTGLSKVLRGLVLTAYCVIINSNGNPMTQLAPSVAT